MGDLCRCEEGQDFFRHVGVKFCVCFDVWVDKEFTFIGVVTNERCGVAAVRRDLSIRPLLHIVA